MVLDTCFKIEPIISFRVVFPQLPVIAIIFAFEFCRKILEQLVKKLSGFLTLNCFDNGSFLLILLTIDKEDFFLIASDTNLFPSIFSPLIAKKISSFLIVFELIDASLMINLFGK